MDANAPDTVKVKRKVNAAAIVAITLACVLVFEKLVGFVHTSDYQARAKRSEALLNGQEQRAQRSEQYFQHIEEDQKRIHALIDRQEQANARFQQVLSTWERQQKEYQAYLDSLKHPQ